ncbi:MAG TPA: glutathionylspermidine synthase family protein [Haloplasmataceae bacterium]
MDARSINETYINIVKQHDFFSDFRELEYKINHCNVIYKGKPVPFLYNPMFFTKHDLHNFSNIAQMIMNIGNKVVNEYVRDVNFRRKFAFPKNLEDLILIDQGYKVNTPIGRFDIFYDGENFSFCELNTDGSSAMNEDNTFARFFLESAPIKLMKEKYHIDYLECIDKWVEESLKIYQEFNHNNKKPTVAIVDFIESATTSEFKEFKKAYEKKGYKTFICDIRELVYHNGKLLYQGEVIDLIYRRAVTKEVIEHYNEVLAFIEAYKNKAVCVVGSFKSQIMHNKVIFKVLHDEDTLQLLTKEEQEFVQRHIPLTKLLEEDSVNEVIKNKDKYILKPLDLYGSRGVFAGLDYDNDKWIEVVKKCVKNDYLYQEYVKPYTRDFINYVNGKVCVNRYKCLIGLFIYNEEFSGLYTRVGENNIISEIHGYYTLPNLIVDEK